MTVRMARRSIPGPSQENVAHSNTFHIRCCGINFSAPNCKTGTTKAYLAAKNLFDAFRPLDLRRGPRQGAEVTGTVDGRMQE